MTPPQTLKSSLRLLVRGGVACAVLALAGCGESEGVAAGATVSVYASAPLCAGAKRELAAQGGRAGDVHVRLRCMQPAEAHGRLDLATIGANARRAVEDSSTVGYIGEPTRAATRFSSTILEEAGIAQVPARPGAAAMSELLKAIGESPSSGSLRESVLEKLER